MAFTRVKPTNWAANEKLTSTQMNQLDTNVANALDKTGDSLTGTIVFSSTGALSGDVDFDGSAIVSFKSGSETAFESGATATVESGASVVVEGYISSNTANGIRTSTAGGIRSNAAGGIRSNTPGGIDLSGGASDHITVTPARTRPVVRNASASFMGGAAEWTQSAASLGNIDYVRHDGTSASNAHFDVPALDGTTLVSLTLYFKTSTTYSGLPSTPPDVTLYRQAGNSTTTASLYSSGAVAYSLSTLAAWNDSATKTITITCDQNNVIDAGTYSYTLNVTGPSGGSGTRYIDVIGYTAVYSYSDLRPQ